MISQPEESPALKCAKVVQELQENFVPRPRKVELQLELAQIERSQEAAEASLKAFKARVLRGNARYRELMNALERRKSEILDALDKLK
jgi:hypothetical protein